VGKKTDACTNFKIKIYALVNLKYKLVKLENIAPPKITHSTVVINTSFENINLRYQTDPL